MIVNAEQEIQKLKETYLSLIIRFKPQQTTSFATFHLVHGTTDNVLRVGVNSREYLPLKAFDNPARGCLTDLSNLCICKTKGGLSFEWRSTNLSPSLKEVIW